MNKVQEIILGLKLDELDKSAQGLADLAQSLIHDGCELDGIKRAQFVKEAEDIYRLAGMVLIGINRLFAAQPNAIKYSNRVINEGMTA